MSFYCLSILVSVWLKMTFKMTRWLYHVSEESLRLWIKRKFLFCVLFSPLIQNQRMSLYAVWRYVELWASWRSYKKLRLASNKCFGTLIWKSEPQFYSFWQVNAQGCSLMSLVKGYQNITLLMFQSWCHSPAQLKIFPFKVKGFYAVF